MKTPRKTKTAQVAIEYMAVAMFVMAAILVIGPYVVRAINAHFQFGSDQVRDSMLETIEQGPTQNMNLLTCTCSELSNTGVCGNGINCALTEMAYIRTCTPSGCSAVLCAERGMYCEASRCVEDPACCTPYLDLGCGVNTPSCADGEMLEQWTCGVTGTQQGCFPHPGCIFHCAIPNGAAGWCDPVNFEVGLPFDDYPVTYVAAGGCGGDPMCRAECPAGWVVLPTGCCDPMAACTPFVGEPPRCGIWPDGCTGGTVDCGGCPGPTTTCVSSSCETCTTAVTNYNCGSMGAAGDNCLPTVTPGWITCGTVWVGSGDGAYQAQQGCYCPGGCALPLPGGCGSSTPYLFVGVGEDYVIENEVLLTYFDLGYENAKQWYEEDKPEKFGFQSTDVYKMRLLPEVKEDGIHLKLKEIQPEESHIDNLRLMRVLYDQKANLITDHQTNEIRVVKRTFWERMTNCEFNGGPCGDVLTSIDTRYLDGKKDDVLEVSFDVSGLKDKDVYLMINGWGRHFLLDPDGPLAAQGCMSSFRTFLYDTENTVNYIELRRLHPRDLEVDHYLEVTDMVKTLTGDTLGVRILWTFDHAMDFLGMITSEEQDYRSEELELNKAQHSEDGDILDSLIQKDHRYGHIVTGNAIDLLFAKPRLQLQENEREGYVFISSGFYHGLRRSLYPEVDTSSKKWKEEVRDYVKDLKDVLNKKGIEKTLAIDFYEKRISP